MTDLTIYVRVGIQMYSNLIVFRRQKGVNQQMIAFTLEKLGPAKPLGEDGSLVALILASIFLMYKKEMCQGWKMADS
ncbi:hypothetical protein PU629_18520 [Pullulanibacillus sp. KACC 23026]|uniref:hypothetical protein n=1 Tax=Pullulanibacillus sp. KACC 23026 TaxID=3028315 RepID=UPI0023B1D231|nr:hypothetical protein [Pullulanibacillus sp. KACC 23026]WEG12094.1 hypothetical protein PU629_18520 [Pullulanibacillus sp. KACC 23026]